MFEKEFNWIKSELLALKQSKDIPADKLIISTSSFQTGTTFPMKLDGVGQAISRQYAVIHVFGIENPSAVSLVSLGVVSNDLAGRVIEMNRMIDPTDPSVAAYAVYVIGNASDVAALQRGELVSVSYNFVATSTNKSTGCVVDRYEDLEL